PRLRLRALGAEEEHVARLQPRERDPRRALRLARHLHRRAAADRLRELRRVRERLRPVDAPDEAGAVEAAAGPDAERRLRALGGAAPDVRVAEELDGAAQDLLLP